MSTIYHVFWNRGERGKRDPSVNLALYIRILSASAIHAGAIRCPVWTSHTADFMIHVRVDATLTIGSYGSAGTCIINYAPP